MWTATKAAEQACSAGRCVEAIELLEQAARLWPGHFELHYTLGICYSGSCRPHAQTSPEMAASYLREALRLLGGGEPAIRAAMLEQLGNAMLHSRAAPREAALRSAIDTHLEAAAIFNALSSRDDAGRIHFNLGNSWCELSEITGEDFWQQSVFHYEAALAVRTRERDPERHAAVLENLGTAYRRLTTGDPGRNVMTCIGCYRRALWVYARRQQPEKSAALQNNLGNAFLSLPAPDSSTMARNARLGLRHLDRALRIRASNQSSRDYAVTQFNRAQAYFRLARAGEASQLEAAAKCLEQAYVTFQQLGDERYSRIVQSQLAGLRRA
jgi:tetratricopeptide (TPR) repeat protein